jgi:hypothetical protein
MENINQQNNPQNSFMGVNAPQAPLKGEKIDSVTTKLNDDLGQALRTLRMLEERYSTIRAKIQVSDQNIIEDTNRIFTQLKLIVKDITDLKIKIEDMRIKLNTFSNEIKEMASKQDLKVLQRYIEMWEPMQFMTEKQAISLIKAAFKEKEDSRKS